MSHYMKLLAALLCLAAFPAQAQSWGPPPACAPPNALGWSGAAWTCSAVVGTQGPAGPAGPAGPQGPAGSGTGGGCTFTPSLEPAGRPITAADQCKLLIYSGAAPATFTFPVPSIALVVCLKATGAGAVSLAPAANFYGGYVTLNKPDDECVSSDGAGKWVLWMGVSPTRVNPNPIQ